MKFAAAALALLCHGCASTPSPAAAQVREADPQMVERCEFIATVIGGSLIGGVVTTGGSNAMVDVREQAAAQGATHVVFVSVDTGGSYSTGKAVARAYRCR